VGRDPAQKILEVKLAAALFGAEVAGGEELAETAEGGAVGGVGEDVGGTVGKAETGANGVAEGFCAFGEIGVAAVAEVAQGDEGFHHAGEGIAVGEAHAAEAEGDGAGDQLLAVRAAAEKGEVSRDHEFGVGRDVDRGAPVDRGTGWNGGSARSAFPRSPRRG
jgi:hypothetical protein